MTSKAELRRRLKKQRRAKKDWRERYFDALRREQDLRRGILGPRTLR